MNTNIKKGVLAVLAAVSVLGVTSAGTVAVLVDKTLTTNNTFALGNVNVRVVEPNWAITLEDTSNTIVGPDGARVPVIDPNNSTTRGIYINKDPAVENYGTNKAWIRVKVNIPQVAQDGSNQAVDLFDVFDWNTAIDSGGKYWILHNGYYYYSVLTEPGKTTEALFTKVKLSNAYWENAHIVTGDMFYPTTGEANTYNLQSITVYAEAIQGEYINDILMDETGYHNYSGSPSIEGLPATTPEDLAAYLHGLFTKYMSAPVPAP
jgi:hypothetical protein